MDWDDEFDNDFREIANDAHRDSSISGIDPVGGLNPMEISNPASAYLFLSDDAQDEINGSDKKKIKCRICGHRFEGEINDLCEKCGSFNTE